MNECYNMTSIADSDEWICSNCGINLAEWVRIVVDEEDNDIMYYEYTFKFCPECGHKVVSRHDK